MEYLKAIRGFEKNDLCDDVISIIFDYIENIKQPPNEYVILTLQDYSIIWASGTKIPYGEQYKKKYCFGCRCLISLYNTTHFYTKTHKNINKRKKHKYNRREISPEEFINKYRTTLIKKE